MDDIINNSEGDPIMGCNEDNEEYPPVMVFSGGRYYMGYLNMDDMDEGIIVHDDIVLSNPLIFTEILDTQHKVVTPIFGKIFHSLNSPKDIQLKYDSIVFLNLESSKDKMIIQLYEKALGEVSAADAGIITPTPGGDNILNLKH